MPGGFGRERFERPFSPIDEGRKQTAKPGRPILGCIIE